MIAIPSWVTKANERRIAQLDHRVQPYAYEFVRRCAAHGIIVLVTETSRSIERQARVWAIGRTKPGKIVTNAKPGWSFHNYDLALDFVPIVNGICAWTRYDLFRICGELAQVTGFVWGARKDFGGDFNTLNDRPHLQMTFGLSVRDLRAGKRPPAVLDDQAYFVFALDRLRALRVIQSPDFWLQNALPGKSVSGTYVRLLIINVAKFINKIMKG